MKIKHLILPLLAVFIASCSGNPSDSTANSNPSNPVARRHLQAKFRATQQARRQIHNQLVKLKLTEPHLMHSLEGCLKLPNLFRYEL